MSSATAQDLYYPNTLIVFMRMIVQMYFTHNYTPVLWYQHLKWRTKIAKGPISVTQLVPRGTNLVAVLLPWGEEGGSNLAYVKHVIP